LRSIRLVWVTVVALQILLIDKYKLNHCKVMGAEPGRRFLIQPAAKLEPVIVASASVLLLGILFLVWSF